ncbi:MAG: hypothetical protein AB7N70_04865 [Dehalococcoidia bacterium]
MPDTTPPVCIEAMANVGVEAWLSWFGEGPQSIQAARLLMERVARAVIAARDEQWREYFKGYREGALHDAVEAAREEVLGEVRAFVERVNARAEARMQEGHKLEGQHWMAMQAELKALEDGDGGEG